MTDKQRKEAERRREEERYRAREEAAKLSDFRDAIGKKLFALARRSPKLADWLEWDKNAVAVDEAIEVAVTARFLKVEETDDAYEEREKLQERIDELGKDLDDFNEHEAEATPDGAKKLIEDYKNLEADMTITAVAIPPKMQNDFDSLEQGYNDVEEYAALDDAGFFDALNKATRDINVLARTDKNGREQITKTTGKGKSAKTVVTPGRFYKTVVADVQKAINNAEAALSATSTLTPGKDGDMEYRSHWGAYAWSQLEDAKGEFDEYDMTKPEAMAKEAHLDFDKANVWLATAKPGSHWLGDWRDAEVLLSHGRLADPSTVAEVLVKWSAAMQDNEKLADMLRTEWVWLKHLYDERVAGPVVPRAPAKPTSILLPKGVKPLAEAKKGDHVQVTYGGETVVGKVMQVKKDGDLTVDISGKHSNEDLGWVTVAVPRAPAAKPRRKGPELLKHVLTEVAIGHPMQEDDEHDAFDAAKDAGLVTGRSDGRSQLTAAGLVKLWKLGEKTTARGTTNVTAGARNDPAWQELVAPAPAKAKVPQDYELVQRGRDRVDVLHKTRTLGHVDAVDGKIEWSPSIPRTRDFGIDLPKAVIQAAMGMLKHSAETKAAPADPGLWPLPKSMPVLTPKVVARAASHHGADPFFLGAVVAALGKGIELGADVGGQFNSGYRSEKSDPGMNYDEGTKAEMALRAAAREVGVLSPVGMTATASDVPPTPIASSTEWTQAKQDAIREALAGTDPAPLKRAMQALGISDPMAVHEVMRVLSMGGLSDAAKKKVATAAKGYSGYTDAADLLRTVAGLRSAMKTASAKAGDKKALLRKVETDPRLHLEWARVLSARREEADALEQARAHEALAKNGVYPAWAAKSKRTEAQNATKKREAAEAAAIAMAR